MNFLWQRSGETIYIDFYSVPTFWFYEKLVPVSLCKPVNLVFNTWAVSYTHLDVYKRQDEIAGERQFTKATIEGHLSHFIKTGDLDINEVVTVQRQQAVQEVILIHGDKSLNLLAQNLPGYSYGEIRMVIANTER